MKTTTQPKDEYIVIKNDNPTDNEAEMKQI